MTKRKVVTKKPDPTEPPLEPEDGGPTAFEELRDTILATDPDLLDPVAFKVVNSRDSHHVTSEQFDKLQNMIDDARSSKANA